MASLVCTCGKYQSAGLYVMSRPGPGGVVRGARRPGSGGRPRRRDAERRGPGCSLGLRAAALAQVAANLAVGLARHRWIRWEPDPAPLAEIHLEFEAKPSLAGGGPLIVFAAVRHGLIERRED